jgi:hypothetical protein
MSQEDQLAKHVLEAYARFEVSLHGQRPFPESEFNQFFQAVWRYAEAVKGQERIHRSVAGTLYGLEDVLGVEALRVPGEVLSAVDRLGSLMFSGCDPYFQGHEPPGL